MVIVTPDRDLPGVVRVWAIDRTRFTGAGALRHTATPHAIDRDFPRICESKGAEFQVERPDEILSIHGTSRRRLLQMPHRVLRRR